MDDCFLRYERTDFQFIQNYARVIMNGKQNGFVKKLILP